MIIGAAKETDKDIMYTASRLYSGFNLKRVYYSGYVPVSNDNRLPGLGSPVPMVRENRLYQTDWLMRFYGFNVTELLNDSNPHLDLDIDPKLSWALRNLNCFPVDINKANVHQILRVPGIGMQSAHKIVSARKFHQLTWDHLKKIGVALNRARYFITCNSRDFERRDLNSTKIKQFILAGSSSKYLKDSAPQLSLF
jgi:predicted DNA-binding helix-hairpin-helix protein